MTTQTTTADSDPRQALQDGAELNADTLTTPATENGSESATGNADESAGKNGNAEAARYRRQLRDTEAERDALTAKVEAFQRAEVERLAGELAQAGDLFDVGGVELADLLDENGEVNTEAVATKIAELLESRPGLSANARIPSGPRYRDFGQGAPRYGGGGSSSHSWHAALRRS
ncbi:MULTISPECIES: hypothetical protein [Rhodococcus]|uniref:Scaffolding protein n=1 Tax=Rhodococcus opacus RKJ300 = JCM 13270 TaxID=1165867 RepID=I0WWN8_RHOOP|nr:MULTISPECIES: hypothetical protein [Rhodococcus]EID80804.1 hypothetical protein W59_06338 [Rhodococcus opacus RKJ300 = JCM 13270]QQZ15222.1 hypothetical protein GO592_03155 [Rhodococcus sp. 21391]